MSGQVIQLRDAIVTASDRTWPANRERGDYRVERRAQAELELRRIVCGHCGTESPLLDGPLGRAWWKKHRCPKVTV